MWGGHCCLLQPQSSPAHGLVDLLTVHHLDIYADGQCSEACPADNLLTTFVRH